MGALSGGKISISAAAAEFFVLEDVEDVSRTGQLAESGLRTLRTVADWIKTFVTRPNKDLGRVGPVCPFVPVAVERETLWLAPGHVADGGAPQIAELMNGYKRRLPEAEPTDGDDVNYTVIVSCPSPTIVLTPHGWNRRNRCTFEGTP